MRLRIVRFGEARQRARRQAGDGSPIARMWSGVVPQQPPTKLSRPLGGELAQRAGHVLGVSS
jgi:hypothetical protein